jgi:molybdopterin adenylyltransferase
MNDVANIGILTVSDRASRGEYDDKSGPAIQDYMTEVVAIDWQAVYQIVADEQDDIEVALMTMADIAGCDLIVTTGGTGPARRDITPEATLVVCDKILPGFGELMRTVSLQAVPTAILSRQIAGIRGQSLIVNLPGSPKAIRECLDAVMPAIPYCIELIGGTFLDLKPERIPAFRPKK